MDILEYDRTHVWHPYASLKDPPPVRLAKGASGVMIEVEGKGPLIDAVSSWWCVAHGHNHPRLVDALVRQSSRLCHVMFGGFTHEPAVELAQRLAAIAPEGLDRVFFADSGSISVEVAVKMATQYQYAKGRKSRTKMLSLKGGYHGDTACAMALSDPDGMHTLFAGMMPKHFFAERPSIPFGGAWDGSTMQSVIDALDEHSDEIAGVICEPVFQAANAMNFYHPQYLAELRRLCSERDILLVFDEIAAGFYRTGPRWAAGHAGVTPDIMTVGKALTGGHMTLAATIASKDVADTISCGEPGAFMHGPTYMANPLACAVAIESLKLFGESDYESKVKRIEGEFRRHLSGFSGENVKSVRILGAAAVIEVGRMPARADIERTIDSSGVWLRPFSNFIYSMPPLVSSDGDIEAIACAMKSLALCEPGPAVSGEFHE